MAVLTINRDGVLVAINITDLPEDLVVGTMCHCDNPEDCDDHWELFSKPNGFDPDERTMLFGSVLNKAQMDAIVALVREARGEEPR